jgi:hypothetical protein
LKGEDVPSRNQASRNQGISYRRTLFLLFCDGMVTLLTTIEEFAAEGFTSSACRAAA